MGVIFNIEKRYTCVIIGLVICLFMAQSIYASTRLGLHVTQEELDIWKKRAVNGPYKTKGDISTNSPGDWDRIKSNADAFLANPSAERWKGQTNPSCWDFNTDPIPGRLQGDKLLSAAFSYLITEDTKYRDSVRNELLAQVAELGTDFSDSSRWCDPSIVPVGAGRTWQITNWLTELLFAYDYIRPNLSSSDRNTLDNWFENAAIWMESVISNNLKTRFPNRELDDYETIGPGSWPCGGYSDCPILTHCNGFNWYGWHESWNNRAASMVRFFGLAGILTGNTDIQNSAKRWFKEWLRYSVFSDGTAAEFYRGVATDGSSPCLGWHYAGLEVGAMASLADAFARNGDPSLYDYTTSEGMFGTEGGPKNLKDAISIHLYMVNRTIIRYGTDDPVNCANPDYIIGPEDQVTGNKRNHDSYMALPNVYYRDNNFKSLYTRTAQDAPSYPSNPASYAACVWCGEWGVYPGVLFMFGQMEGLVWPYPHSADTNQDGCIDMIELMAFIGRWKNGEVDMLSLMEAIGEWKSGCS